jgi:hypothetical protein
MDWVSGLSGHVVEGKDDLCSDLHAFATGYFLFLEFHLQRQTFNPHVDILIYTNDFSAHLWIYILHEYL